jgi:hypothetical protein
MFYVYVYLDPRKPGTYNYNEYSFDYEPFYVGKGCGKRYLAHLKENKKSYKNNKIKAILNESLKPIIIKLKENLIECSALKLEIDIIKIIGRLDLKIGPLTNLTAGGESITGFKFSNESKLKMSIIAKEGFKSGIRNVNGKNNGMYGKTFTKAQKENRSKIFSGKNNSFYGKTHSDKTKEKIGLKTIERCKNVEYLKKLSDSHKGFSVSDSAKEKLSNHFKCLKFINKDGIIKRAKGLELENYIKNGWKFGRK